MKNQERFGGEGWDVDNLREGLPVFIENCGKLLSYFDNTHGSEPWYRKAAGVHNNIFDEYAHDPRRIEDSHIEEIMILQRQLAGFFALSEQHADLRGLKLEEVEDVILSVSSGVVQRITNPFRKDIDLLLSSKGQKPPARDLNQASNINQN